MVPGTRYQVKTCKIPVQYEYNTYKQVKVVFCRVCLVRVWVWKSDRTYGSSGYGYRLVQVKRRKCLPRPKSMPFFRVTVIFF